MAPPSIRRTGFSKRAQYGTFFGYIAAIVGALLGGALLVVSYVDPDAFSGLRGTASDAAAPVGKVVATGRAEGNGFLDTIGIPWFWQFLGNSRNWNFIKQSLNWILA